MSTRRRVAAAAVVGTKLAVKYGPQAKIAWDNGGRQAVTAAANRAISMAARRKAIAHASTVKDGAILKVAPEGSTAYVVFTGDVPIASYPQSDLPLATLLAHADLDKRERAEDAKRRPSRRPRRPDPANRELG